LRGVQEEGKAIRGRGREVGISEKRGGNRWRGRDGMGEENMVYTKGQ